MAYLAMARKWRPRNFEEMVGQDHIAQTIRNAIAGQRISHAYLFTGTRGVGKTTSARILAKALNCKRGPTATPCDDCDNCRAVNAGSSMDVLEIDAASNTGVDNIRDLREQVKYAPMNGSYKIYVVDEVHMLSKSAFNALLKTLEEPPPHVVFIFATTEVNKVPQTILSRVQRFDFKRISEARIRERLEYICGQEAIQPEREALEALARKADGSMRDALSLFDQVYAFSGADLTLEAVRKVLGLPRERMFDLLLRGLAAHDQKACFDLLQEAHREGVETGDLLIAFGEYLRNLLFASQGVQPGALGLSDGRHAELASLAGELRLKDGDILRYAKAVSDLLAGLKSAANPSLSVELGFARLAGLDRVVTLSQLLGGELPSLPAAAARPAVAAPADEAKKKSPEPTLSPAPAIPREPAPDFPAPPAEDRFAAFTSGPDAAPAPRNPIAPSASPSQRPPAPVHDPAVSSIAPVPSAEARAHEAATATAVLIETAPPPAVPSEPAPGDGLPAMQPPAYAAAGAATPSDSIDAESEVEPDLEYPADPEDPDMPGPGAAIPPPPPKAEAPEAPVKVPPQEGADRLPRLWPQLIAELMAERPMLATQLRRTRLEGEGAALRLVFLDKGTHALLAEDGDFRKNMLAFLTSKLRAGAEIQLKYLLDEEAAAAAEAAGPSVADEAPGEEPILGFIRALFEGRTVG